MENTLSNSEAILSRFISGYHQYILEGPVHVAYVSENLCAMTGYSADELLNPRWDMYALLVHPGDREAYLKFLNKASENEMTLTAEYRLIRKDGTILCVRDTFVSGRDEHGVLLGHSVLTDITDTMNTKAGEELGRYLNVLGGVYEKIFEFDRAERMVRCLHCEPGSSFENMKGISMRSDDILEKWIAASVASDSRNDVREFFKVYFQTGASPMAGSEGRGTDSCGTESSGMQTADLEERGGRPPQVRYKAMSADGNMHEYIGIFIKADERNSFFCCRRLQETEAGGAAMRDLMLKFSDGIAAFEVTPKGEVKPLYASENVCEFFGYSQDEWMWLTEHYTPLEVFAAYSEASVEEFAKLLKKGEAEFTYFDYKSEKERRITAICSQKEPDPNASRYVMLYAQKEDAKRSISVRTFGYFEVFVDGHPIPFRNKKSKELLALLVDRRGGFVTSEEAIGYLWEEEPVDALTLARYRKAAMRLKNTLEEYGIDEIMENVDGKRRIVPERVECDLFEHLSGAVDRYPFRGSYMTNYGWGEVTLGELMSGMDM